MNNTVYNIFAVIGMLNCTVILVVLFVMLYCWIGDMWLYYFGRTNHYKIGLRKQQNHFNNENLFTQYEPMENPITVDLSIRGSMPEAPEALARSFSGGRYR